MTDRLKSRALYLGLGLSLLACASDEDALRAEVKDLRYDVGQAQQRNHDLKRRMQLAEARNRVLIDLVKGLTAEPGSTAAASGGRRRQCACYFAAASTLSLL